MQITVTDSLLWVFPSFFFQVFSFHWHYHWHWLHLFSNFIISSTRSFLCYSAPHQRSPGTNFLGFSLGPMLESQQYKSILHDQCNSVRVTLSTLRDHPEHNTIKDQRSLLRARSENTQFTCRVHPRPEICYRYFHFYLHYHHCPDDHHLILLYYLQKRRSHQILPAASPQLDPRQGHGLNLFARTQWGGGGFTIIRNF